MRPLFKYSVSYQYSSKDNSGSLQKKRRHVIRRKFWSYHSWANNGMERFFRKIMWNIKKHTSISYTGDILSQNLGEKTLFQNVGNSKCLRAVFGTVNSKAIASVFEKYRNPFKGRVRTVKETRSLVREYRSMIMDQRS